jgi:hypothetical protein
VALRAGASEDQVTATYKDGILEVRVPVNPAEAKARTIQITKMYPAASPGRQVTGTPVARGGHTEVVAATAPQVDGRSRMGEVEGTASSSGWTDGRRRPRPCAGLGVRPSFARALGGTR